MRHSRRSTISSRRTIGVQEREARPAKEATKAGGNTDLRIEDMRATRPEDIQEILAGIPDKAAFNVELQRLLFETLIPNWCNLNIQEQMLVAGKIIRWQSLAVERNSGGIFASRQDVAQSG